LIEHLTQNQVEDYRRQRLEPVELLSVADHLAECEACRGRIERAMNGNAAFFALRSEALGEPAEIFPPYPARAHPTSEQASDYVDGNLAGEDLQMVDDHLTNCHLCALMVDDLRAFRNQIAPDLQREYQPAPAPIPTERWWHRMTAPLPALLGRSPGLAFGTALAIVLVTVTGWLIWRSIPLRETNQEVVVLPPAPSPPTGVAPAAKFVALLKDGEHQLTLDEEGKLSGADELPLEYQSKVKEALTKQRIEASSNLKGLARPSSSLMSSDKQKSAFFVIEPVGRVLMTDRPTFRWSSMAGATGYVVEVYDENFDAVATSPQVPANSWRAPQPLGRGGVFSWQVKAIKDGQEFTSPQPPAPQARFRILNQRTAGELAKAKRSYPSSHLALGLLYAEAGLLKEAEEEFRVLQKANPDSEIARKLFGQIQSLRRRSG
jgi:anti-sigma factor RsiW